MGMSIRGILDSYSEQEGWNTRTEKFILLCFLDRLIEDGNISSCQFCDYIEDEHTTSERN